MQLEEIKKLSVDDLLNEKTVALIREAVEECVTSRTEGEMTELFARLFNLYKSARSKLSPILRNLYSDQMVKLAGRVIYSLDDAEISWLLGENLARALKNGVDLLPAIQFYINFYDDYYTDFADAKRFLKLMRENEEKLGPRTVKEWLADYLSVYANVQRGALQRTTYFNADAAVKNLQQTEKDILLKIFATDDWLSNPPPPEGAIKVKGWARVPKKAPVAVEILPPVPPPPPPPLPPQPFVSPLDLHQAVAEKIIEASGLKVEGESREHFKTIIISHLTDVRDRFETLAKLEDSLEKGGLALDKQEAERVLKLIDKEREESLPRSSPPVVSSASEKSPIVAVMAGDLSASPRDDQKEKPRDDQKAPRDDQGGIDSSTEPARVPLAIARGTLAGSLLFIPAIQRYDDMAEKIAKESGVAVAADLRQRLKILIISRFKDVRKKGETLERLILPTDKGGLALSSADAEKILNLVEKERAMMLNPNQALPVSVASDPPAPTSPPPLPVISSASSSVISSETRNPSQSSSSPAGDLSASPRDDQKEKPRDDQRKMKDLQQSSASIAGDLSLREASPEPSRGAPLEMTKKTPPPASLPASPPPPQPQKLPPPPARPRPAGTSADIKPAPPQALKIIPDQNLMKVEPVPLPMTLPPPPKPPLTVAIPTTLAGKSRVEDIGYKPRLIGPIEELQSLTLTDFRRLSPTPQVASDKIYGKIELLSERSFEDKIKGIRAWQNSEVHRLYLDILNESLNQLKPVAQVISGRMQMSKDNMKQEEWQAVMELNRKLRI